MQFGSSKTLLLRLAASSVAEQPRWRHRAISVLVANFSSSNAISGSISGQFTSKRTQHDEESLSRGVGVSVWWDFENCHLPSGVNVFKVAQAITSAVRINGIKGPITITAFGDVFQLSRTNQEALSASGISLTHVPQGGKNSADRSLITDLMCWVARNPPPAHLFLISSDRDFASVLHKLRMSNYNILLAGYDEKTPGVLCSAASIMWDWNALVRGKNSIGKHFNQPPDGPYNSWYGHYRTPLLDPFDTSSSTITKQQPCSSVKSEELCESSSDPNSGSSKVYRPIPEEVVKQIGLVLSLYPKGAPITELRDQLSKRNVALDRNFYGHQRFSRFLLSMPNILRVVSKGKGVFLVHACTQEMDNEALSPELSSENSKVVSVENMHQKVEQSVEDVKKESQSEESSQESVPIISQMDAQANDEPVKENQLARTAEDDVYKSLNRLWVGIKSASLSRVLKLFKFLGRRNAELCNAAESGTQVDDVFAKDSFWKDVESSINSPRGFVLVSHSRSREELAKNLKDEGPSCLKTLDVSKMLDLVSLLVSEKKWIKENPGDALPFRVTRFTEKGSSGALNGLRSIFVNMSESQRDEADGEKSPKSQKPTERSRSEVIADCHKLIKKITEENPGGYNMGCFKKDFLEKFGYRLNHQSLGYLKLQSLIQLMPEARIESGYIVPSSTPAPYDSSDTSFEELGPVSNETRECEPSVSEKEDSDSDQDEDASLKQSGDERKKKKGDETKSDLLRILSSWDTVKDVEKTEETISRV